MCSYQNRLQNASIKKWISEGADPQKLVIGVPFYGHSWKLANASDTSVGSLSWTPGPPGPYLEVAGTLGYNEVSNGDNLL